MEFVRGVLRSSRHNNFPCPQPSSLERKDLSAIRDGYWVSSKFDGERRIVVINGSGATSHRRNGEICKIIAKFPRFAYRLTIFDCELVGSVHHVIDCFACNGNDIHNLPYSARRNAANDVIEKMIIGKSEFSLKAVFPVSLAKNIYNPDESDGLIFTPENHPVKYGTDDKLFKWKPLTKHTVDFKVIFHSRVNLDKKWISYLEPARDRGYDLLIKGDGQNTFICWEPEEIFGTVDSGTIVECFFDSGHWRPMRVRDDKIEPNSLFVFRRTLTCIKENICLDELS